MIRMKWINAAVDDFSVFPMDAEGRMRSAAASRALRESVTVFAPNLVNLCGHVFHRFRCSVFCGVIPAEVRAQAQGGCLSLRACGGVLFACSFQGFTLKSKLSMQRIVHPDEPDVAHIVNPID